jgi:hypothetical protein
LDLAGPNVAQTTRPSAPPRRSVFPDGARRLASGSARFSLPLSAERSSAVRTHGTSAPRPERKRGQGSRRVSLSREAGVTRGPVSASEPRPERCGALSVSVQSLRVGQASSGGVSARAGAPACARGEAEQPIRGRRSAAQSAGPRAILPRPSASRRSRLSYASGVRNGSPGVVSRRRRTAGAPGSRPGLPPPGNGRKAVPPR